MKLDNQPKKENKRYHNLIGKKFNRLTVISLSEQRSKNGTRYWNCLCDCGNSHLAITSNLNNKATTSCGCLTIEKIKKHWQTHKKIAPNTLEYGESSFRRIFGAYKDTAAKRGLDFKLNYNEFKDLTKKNCYYCDSLPKQTKIRKGYHGQYTYNGVDRIDSDLGYFLENCRPCCKFCNYAKRDYKEDEFIKQIIKMGKWLSEKEKRTE